MADTDTDPRSTFDQRYQRVDTQTNIGGDYYTGDTAYDVRGLSNPYLGLKAYTYAERARYAGREADIARAITMLTKAGAERPLLFITGASGSGKSSFAQAGLLPALEAFYQNQGFDVKMTVMRPGEQPLAELARAMHALALPLDGVFAPAADYQLRVPVESADPNQVSLLIIDQFEELFSQSEGSQRAALFELLGNLPPFKTSRLHLIATMRADYLPDLFPYAALYNTAKAGIDVRVMTVDELKAAIQKPLQAVHPDAGKRFQTALLNRLAKDAAEDAAYLPLLQVTLEDIWRGGFLTADYYESLTDAIRKRADEIYHFKREADGSKTPRSQAQQALMLDLFLALVEVSFDEDVRRDVRRTRRLADVTKGDPAVEDLVHELAASRLLVTDEKELDGSGQEVETVDIIHESLIQNWDRLSDAIQEARLRLQQRRRFELRLDEWLDSEQAKDRLLIGVQLEEAIRLQELEDVAIQSDDARQFVAQSIHERDRRRSRNQRITISVIAALGLLFVSAVVAAGLLLQRSNELASTRDELEVTITDLEGKTTDLQNREIELEESLDNERIQRSIAEQQAILNLSRTIADGEERQRLHLAAIRMAQAEELPPRPEALTALMSELSEAPLFAAETSATLLKSTFDPDNRFVGFVDSQGAGQLYDLHSREVVTLPTELVGISSIHFLPDSDRFIAATRSQIHVLDAENMKTRCLISMPGQHLSLQDLNGDNSLLLTGDGGTLRLWSLDECEELALLPLATDIDTWEAASLGLTRRLRVFFNANGTQIIARVNELLYRWDITNPESPMELAVQEVGNPVFNADRTQLLYATGDEVVRLDTTRGREEPTGLAQLPLAAQLGPDGQLLLTRKGSEPITLWDVATGESRGVLVEDEPINGVRWVAHTEPEMLVARTERGIALYAAETGESIPFPRCCQDAAEVKDAVVEPSGRRLIIEYRDLRNAQKTEVWDLATEERLADYDFGSTSMFNSIEFSSDGQLMAVLGRDSALRVWELPTATETYDLVAGPNTVFALRSEEGTGLTLVDAATNETVQEVSLEPEPRFTPEPSHMDGWLLDDTCEFDARDCTLRIWDLNHETVRLHYTLPCDKYDSGCPSLQNAEELHISKDGRWLVASNYGAFDEEADPEGTVAVWDLQTEQRLPLLEHERWVEALAMNPVAPQMATMDADGVVQLWNLADDPPTAVTIPFEYSGVPYPVSLEFSADGKRLLHTAWEASGIGSLLIWDVASLALLEHYQPDSTQGKPGVRDFRIAPDGESIFVVLQEDIGSSVVEQAFLPGLQIQRWQIDGLAPMGKPMIINAGEISSLAFFPRSADGELLLATAGSDGLARVWHVDTGDLLLEVPHDVGVDQVVFAPDGRGLFTLDSEQQLHTWPIDFTESSDQAFGLVPEACRRLSRDFTQGEWTQYFGDRPQEPLCPQFASSTAE